LVVGQHFAQLNFATGGRCSIGERRAREVFPFAASQ
jgi:hypothetical protein